MAGISFLSTVTSPFGAIGQVTAKIPTSCYYAAGRIQCSEIEANVGVDADGFRRRDVLHCAVLSAGMLSSQVLMHSSGLFLENANAADLIQRKQRSEFLSSIKGTLATAIKGNPDIMPLLLTLALNDCMTYDKFAGHKIWRPQWFDTL